MSKNKYQRSRDAAWSALLASGVAELPVDLNAVTRALEIRVRTYQTEREFLRRNRLEAAARATDGMALFAAGAPAILFDSDRSPRRIRFTVAHEIGHLVLGHVRPGERTTVNREPSSEDSPTELAANVFAGCLLAPTCVVRALGLRTAEEIARACNVSTSAAEFRVARLEQEPDDITSPLEEEVFRAFRPYIERVRG